MWMSTPRYVRDCVNGSNFGDAETKNGNRCATESTFSLGCCSIVKGICFDPLVIAISS